MGFWSGLLAAIIRPILEDAIKDVVNDYMVKTDIYKKHNDKQIELSVEMAQADTDEERDAILTKIYNNRPKFD